MHVIHYSKLHIYSSNIHSNLLSAFCLLPQFKFQNLLVRRFTNIKRLKAGLRNLHRDRKAPSLSKYRLSLIHLCSSIHYPPYCMSAAVHIKVDFFLEFDVQKCNRSKVLWKGRHFCCFMVQFYYLM